MIWLYLTVGLQGLLRHPRPPWEVRPMIMEIPLLQLVCNVCLYYIEGTHYIILCLWPHPNTLENNRENHDVVCAAVRLAVVELKGGGWCSTATELLFMFFPYIVAYTPLYNFILQVTWCALTALGIAVNNCSTYRYSESILIFFLRIIHPPCLLITMCTRQTTAARRCKRHVF